MRFLSFVLVAAGVHLLIPLGARLAPRWDSLQLARTTGIAQRMLIEIEPLVEIPELPKELLEPNKPRQVEPNEVVQPRTNIDPSTPTSPTANVDPTAVPSTAVEPPTPTGSSAPPDEYGMPPPVAGTGVPGVPGIGTGPLWSIPGVVPETGKPKPAPTTIAAPPPTDPKLAGRVIADLVREKDRQLGLDLPGAGTIASVVQQVVLGSTTPAEARATLEVRLAPGGKVSSVRIVRSSAGNMGDWAAVASAVSGRLSGNQFTMPTAYAAGAIVMVEVVSRMQMPDGSTGGGPAIQGGGSDSVGGSVNFDAANIGARPKRHVKAFASARPVT